MMAAGKIILGSSSTARMSILKEMGVEFDVVKAGIDESAIRRPNPEDLVLALAEAKAAAIIPRVQKLQPDLFKPGSPAVLLITADQVVVHEGVVKEKPQTEEEARTFIHGYSRSPATTVSAVVVTNLTTGFKKGGVDKAEIYFHPIPEDVVDTLIAQGRVYEAAGGLLVEHPLVSPLVEAMIGTVDSVMGLPKALTAALLAEAAAAAAAAA